MIYNETGRSMVEMLGVLAIIGVLSVGGIAGYSKAMDSYRVNKTIDQVSQIATNIRILFGSQKNYADLGGGSGDANTWELVHKANLFPDEMVIKSGNEAENRVTDFVNPYGGIVNLYTRGVFTSGDNANSFVILYEKIPGSACISLATLNWNVAAGDELVAVAISSGSAQATFVGVKYGNTCKSELKDNYAVACVRDGHIPMSVQWASAVCKNGSNNYIAWKFQ